MRSRGIFYRGDGHDVSRDQTIVERGEINPTSIDKVQRGLHIQHQRVGALNGIDHLFRLLDDARMARGMGGDGIGALELGGGGDVEERSIGGHRRVLGAGQELLVGVAEISHGVISAKVDGEEGRGEQGGRE